MRTRTDKQTPSKVTALLCLAFLVMSGQNLFSKVKPDWSQVQAVAPGKRTVVILYDDSVGYSNLKFIGPFGSANKDSITLIAPGSMSRTIQKHDIKKVRVIRPLKKRYSAWMTMGIVGASTQIFLSIVGDAPPKMKALLHASTTGLVGAWSLFDSRMRMGTIYSVPIRAQKSPVPQRRHIPRPSRN